MRKNLANLVACLAAGMLPIAACASAGGQMAGGEAAPADAAEAQAPPDAADAPTASDHPYLYVANTNSSSVSVVDMATDEVVETVDLQALGFSANAKPHHVVVEPDGSFWYVSLITDGYVLKFDRDNELIGRVAVEVPGMLALDVSSDRLYVGRSMSVVNPPHSIGVIDRSSMELLEEVGVFVARPHAMLVTPDGQHVYTASLASNEMVVYVPSTGETEVISVPGPGDHPHTFVQFALSPDGRRLVVGGEMSGQVLVMNATRPMEIPVIETIEVGGAPWHPVFAPDGSRVYFGNNRADAVTFIDTSDWSVERVVEDERFATPHGIAISPDGSKLYLGNRNATPEAGAEPENGFVAVIDTTNGQVLKLIEVGRYAVGMGTAAPVY